MRKPVSTRRIVVAASSLALLGAVGVAAQSLELHDRGIRFPDGSELTTARGRGLPQANVLVVAGSGGQFGSIQAALDAIGGVGPFGIPLPEATESNPYLIRVAPGLYEERVVMKPWVDIEGSGEGVTRILAGGSPVYPNWSGALAGADHAELRHLTVESRGGGQPFAFAILNRSASPALTHVTAVASGGTSGAFAVVNALGSSPQMTFVTAEVSGHQGGAAVANNDGSSPLMRQVIARATTPSSDEDSTVTGVANGDHSSPTMIGVIAEATGQGEARGVSAVESCALVMRDVTVRAYGADTGVAISLGRSSSLEASGLIAEATGLRLNIALVATETSSADVRHAALGASGGSERNEAVHVDGPSSVRVAYSEVVGDIAGSPASCLCLGAYDAALTPLNDNCQPW